MQTLIDIAKTSAFKRNMYAERGIKEEGEITTTCWIYDQTLNKVNFEHFWQV